jgi:hypothetical protein
LKVIPSTTGYRGDVQAFCAAATPVGEPTKKDSLSHKLSGAVFVSLEGVIALGGKCARQGRAARHGAPNRDWQEENCNG